MEQVNPFFLPWFHPCNNNIKIDINRSNKNLPSAATILVSMSIRTSILFISSSITTIFAIFTFGAATSSSRFLRPFSIIIAIVSSFSSIRWWWIYHFQNGCEINRIRIGSENEKVKFRAPKKNVLFRKTVSFAIQWHFAKKPGNIKSQNLFSLGRGSATKYSFIYFLNFFCN